MEILRPTSRDEFKQERYQCNEAVVWGVIEIDTEEETVMLKQTGYYFHDNTRRHVDGIVQRFRIPNVTLETANQILYDHAHLFQRIIDGGGVTDDAEEARLTLTALLEKIDDEIYLTDVCGYMCDSPREFSVTAETTDEELEKLADEITANALIDHDVDVEGVLDWLFEYRNELREG
jgi:hypothetical protein